MNFDFPTAITDSQWRDVIREIKSIAPPDGQPQIAAQAANSDDEIFEAGFYLAIHMVTNKVHQLAQYE